MIENIAKNNVRKRLKAEGISYKELRKRDFKKMVAEEKKTLLTTWGSRAAVTVFTGGLLGF